jgi:nitronate monooxygenase
MAGISTPELAVAVSAAGGLGSIGCHGLTPEEIRAGVGVIRQRTTRPFNLNFFVDPAPATPPEVWEAMRDRLRPWYAAHDLGAPPETAPDLPSAFAEPQLSAVLDLRPAVVSFHFGLPDPSVVARIRAAGIRVLSTATSVAEARALEAAGVDAIIAQGWEAGGHHGSHRPAAPGAGVGTMALVPQVVDAVAVPVIAAGGIADGRGIAAALALGAAGVQMGTAFLTCPEAGTDATRRALLAQATETDTVMTDAVSGRSARARRSRYSDAMAGAERPFPAFRQLYALTQPLLRAASAEEASFHHYGQAAPLCRPQPAADLVARLVAETAAALARLAG